MREFLLYGEILLLLIIIIEEKLLRIGIIV